MNDYYDVLGVNRGASAGDIKKAYRSLARKYHPDVSIDKGDDDKFKEINEAYSVLSDNEKRMNYDRYGTADAVPDPFNGINVQDFMNRGRRSRGDVGTDIKIGVNLTLEEMYSGVTKEIKYNRDALCSHCNGKKVKDIKDLKKCEKCKGHGFVEKFFRVGSATVKTGVPCKHCFGTGEKITNPCKPCHGKGTIREEAIEKVDIPRGVSANNVMEIPNMGNEGLDRSGTLYCFMQEKKHERFQRGANDLLLNKTITLEQALLCDDIVVKLIDGSKKKIKVDDTIQPGYRTKLKGKGMPIINTNYFGDLYINFKVVLPILNSEQKDKLRKNKSIIDGVYDK